MTMTRAELVRAAARNNAEWCAAVCRVHGVGSGFGAGVWAARGEPPVYYPGVVTLVPGAEAAAGGAGAVKDSFADLDLTGDGYRVLFEAQWIHRGEGEAGASWERVDSAEGLREWAAAWGEGGEGLFLPGVLAEPDVYVVAGRDGGGRVVCGAVVSGGGGVAGVSNVFAAAEGGEAWPVVLAAVAELCPGLEVVGYEHGEELAVAQKYGFEAVAPLRVWVREG